jgi:iron complex outermembrane receptor protein
MKRERNGHSTGVAMVMMFLGVGAGVRAAEAPGGKTAAAAAADDDVIQEVIVTSERTETLLSRTPVAISAVTGDTLRDKNVQNIADLQNSIPSMQIAAFGPISRVTLRGVGMENYVGGNVAGDSGIAFVVDDVLYTRPQMITPGFFDVARIEVLRGPQAALYGQNATGGAVNVVSAAPTNELDGYARVAFGSRDLQRGEFAVGGPLVDGLLNGRVAVRANHEEGQLNNTFTGGTIGDVKEKQIRVRAAFLPGHDVTLDLSGDYYKNDGTGSPVQYLPNPRGVTPPGVLLGGQYQLGKWSVSENTDGFTRAEIWGTSAKLKAATRLADVSLVTAYRFMDADDGGDLDGTTGLWAAANHHHDLSDTFSTELNVTSVKGSTISWLVGALYLDERGSGFQEFPLYQLGDYMNGGSVHTYSRGVYAQAVLPLLSNLNLTVADRYSVDRKSDTEFLSFAPVGNFTDAGSKRWSANSPRATLDWTIANGLLAYATYAKGYKSGGFNLGALQGGPYNPEYVKDFESGIKARLFEGRAQLNLAGFHYDYTNMQVSQIMGVVVGLVNAASSSINGFELEGEARLSANLTATLSYGFLDAKFDRFLTEEGEWPELGVQNLEGNTVPNSPRNSASLGLDYEVGRLLNGSLNLHGDVSYKSRIYFSGFNRDYTAQPGYALADARVTYNFADSRFQLAVFGSNLLDKKFYVSSIVGAAVTGGFAETIIGPRRVIGAEFAFEF